MRSCKYFEVYGGWNPSPLGLLAWLCTLNSWAIFSWYNNCYLALLSIDKGFIWPSINAGLISFFLDIVKCMKKSDGDGICSTNLLDLCTIQIFRDKVCPNRCMQCPSRPKLTKSSIKKTNCPFKVVNNQHPVACWELNLGKKNDKEIVYFYPAQICTRIRIWGVRSKWS